MFLSLISFPLILLGQLARHIYGGMRREASCQRIQRNLRMHFARKAYKDLCCSAISIQTGMRGMTARRELRFRKQTRAAVMIQVRLIYVARGFLKQTLHQFYAGTNFFILLLTFLPYTRARACTHTHTYDMINSRGP